MTFFVDFAEIGDAESVSSEIFVWPSIKADAYLEEVYPGDVLALRQTVTLVAPRAYLQGAATTIVGAGVGEVATILTS